MPESIQKELLFRNMRNSPFGFLVFISTRRLANFRGKTIVQDVPLWHRLPSVTELGTFSESVHKAGRFNVCGSQTAQFCRE